MSKTKDFGKELYHAALLTAGAVGVSFVSRKLTKESLGVPMTLNGAAKLTLAFGLSAVGIKMLEDKSYVPDDPFKSWEKNTVIGSVEGLSLGIPDVR
jgi:hypothetical protein